MKKHIKDVLRLEDLAALRIIGGVGYFLRGQLIADAEGYLLSHVAVNYNSDK